MKSDRLYVLHIRDAIAKIQRYTDPLTHDVFVQSDQTKDATLYQILIIGEAVNHLSQMFCEEHRDIPWHDIVGMRNRLIHGYDEVDDEEVWRVVRDDVPALQQKIDAVIRTFPAE